MRFAAEEVDDARVSGRGRALDVSLGDDGAAIVSVVLTAPRGAVLPELGKHVQHGLLEALVETLDVPPSRIDVTVEAFARRKPADARAARSPAHGMLSPVPVGSHRAAADGALRGDVDPFSRELAEAVSGEAAELDRIIDSASDAWPADRLGVLERNILRIGIYELVHATVPVPSGDLPRQ